MSQDLRLPPSSFTVLAQPHDQVLVTYQVRVEVPPSAPVAVEAVEAAEGKDAVETDKALSAETVLKIERHSAVGWVLQRQTVQTQVALQDGQMKWFPNEDVAVHLPMHRFAEGTTVHHAGWGLGQITSRSIRTSDSVEMYTVTFQGQIPGLPGQSHVRSVEDREVMSEKAWWSQKEEEATSVLGKLEQKLPEAEAEEENATKAVYALHGAFFDKEKAFEDANKALNKVKHSSTLKVQTLVSFKRGKARPRAWRDIANFVELRWVVCAEVPQERPVILSLEDVKGMARSVVTSGCPGPNIISAKGQKLNRCVGAKPRKGAYLSLARQTAKQVLKHQKKNAPGPEPMHAFALLKAAVGAQPGVVLDAAVEEFYQGPEIGLIRVKEVPPPEQLKDVLRPYQLSGYHWLVNNARNGLGCILADDMGLGKTLQAIAMMLYMKQHGMLNKPMLVVVPKGLLGTWKKELKRWAGDELRLHIYVGPQRQVLPHMAPASAVQAPPAKCRRLNGKQNAKKLYMEKKAPKARVAKQSADVFLTSYGTFRGSVDALSVPDAFGGMLLDEAQQIKNHNTLISKAVKTVAEHVGPIRVSLSGTPVENKLLDLHSQFEYILPGYVASSKADFQRSFGRPVTNSVRRSVRSQAAAAGQATGQDHAGLASGEALRRLVKPFLMRRLKSDPEIAADLPEKIEQDQECELTDTQKRIYKAIQEKCLDDTLKAEGFQRHGQVLKMLHALRELCNHPQLVAPARRPESMVKAIEACDGGAKGSGKIERLMEVLEEILEGGQKVLIFSNYLNTIGMLQELISKHFKKDVLKIVGEMDTDAREAAVEKFQNDPQQNFPVLILSIKAGGVGLTLTAATHVIHFDRQYNPAIEAQATDRAHRIGQKSTVVVHRLISKDTFEEKLNTIMQEKKRLSDVTVRPGEDWIADLNDQELRDLFSLSS